MNDFYTQKGYDRKNHNDLSRAMEDYLEMICRTAKTNEYARVNAIAAQLNVTPSSASKMASKLREKGFVDFEPYGILRPTEKGWETGRYLLRRHEVLHRFFCLVNQSENELELVEQIEHYINRKTIDNMEKLMERLEEAKQNKAF